MFERRAYYPTINILYLNPKETTYKTRTKEMVWYCLGNVYFFQFLSKKSIYVIFLYLLKKREKEKKSLILIPMEFYLDIDKNAEL